MGVDTTANFGIGFRIKKLPYDAEDDLYYEKDDTPWENMYEYLDAKIRDDRYTWFAVGDWCYSGDDNEYYIVFKGRFSDIAPDLGLHEADLYEYIESIGLEVEGPLDLYGGLEWT